MMYIPKSGTLSHALEYVSASSGGCAKTELQHLMQSVETQLAHHHAPPSLAAREVKPGTREEAKRLCDTLRSQQEIRQLQQGNFGNGSCRIHVLI